MNPLDDDKTVDAILDADTLEEALWCAIEACCRQEPIEEGTTPEEWEAFVDDEMPHHVPEPKDFRPVWEQDEAERWWLVFECYEPSTISEERLREYAECWFALDSTDHFVTLRLLLQQNLEWDFYRLNGHGGKTAALTALQLGHESQSQQNLRGGPPVSIRRMEV